MIQKKNKLKVLDLVDNSFLAEQTEILLKTITEARMFGSLTNLNLFNAANLTSDENVHYLALILSKAPNLELVNIAG